MAQLHYHVGNCWDTLKNTAEKLNSLQNGRDSNQEPQEHVITRRLNQFSQSNVFFPFKKRFNKSHPFLLSILTLYCTEVNGRLHLTRRRNIQGKCSKKL